MIVVHDVGNSEVGELAGQVVVGERGGLRFEHNQPRRQLQPVADITYPAENVESKKEAPSKKGRWCFLSLASSSLHWYGCAYPWAARNAVKCF